MKKLFAMAFELLAYIAIGLIVGRYIDAAFSLKGWGIIGSVFLVYLLWFLQFYKRLR